MNLLVTGCAGFVGWKVCELGLHAGFTVVGVDHLRGPVDVRLKSWRLEQLKLRPGFRFVQADVNDAGALGPVFAQYVSPATGVVHLAARAGVRQSIDEPYPYYETNVLGTLGVLELCREHGVKKFIIASTSSVYGAPPSASNGADRFAVPMSEDMPTDRPLSPYAASKKAAEVLAYVYHSLYGVDVSVLRLFTVYGPAGRTDMAVLRFVHAIAEGVPVTLHGDGSQQRDFTYVDDVAQGILLAAKPLGFAVINLGSEHPVSLWEVIRYIEQIAGKRAVVEMHPLPFAEPPVTWADIGRAKQTLGWSPATSIEEGLRRTVQWYRENRSWLNSERVLA